MSSENQKCSICPLLEKNYKVFVCRYTVTDDILTCYEESFNYIEAMIRSSMVRTLDSKAYAAATISGIFILNKKTRRVKIVEGKTSPDAERLLNNSYPEWEIGEII